METTITANNGAGINGKVNSAGINGKVIANANGRQRLSGKSRRKDR